MKNIIIIIGVIVILAVVVFFYAGRGYKSQPVPAATPATSPASQTPSQPATGANAVDIKNFAFSPSTLTVKKGDSVTWTNNDSTTHTVTSSGNFDSGQLAPGKTFSHTFSEAGTFSYGCSIHPSMKGTVTVQ